MKIFCRVALVVCVCFIADSARATDHVVLISVDGFRPDFYLDREWPAPAIQSMASEGVQAERVRSVFPSVTYPSHTTMVTGVQPAKHGILFNLPFEPEGQTGRWYWESDAIQVPTIFSALRAAGMKTAAVSWPVTVGAPIDWFVPEVWSLDAGGDRLAPMKSGTKPDGLWDEIQREATGKLDVNTYSADYMARDLKTGAAAAYILQTYRPALLALHLIATDHFQHQDGRDSALTRRALATADAAIGTVIEGAQRAGIYERTAFIITGDHGFVNIHTSLAPNVWLKKAGLHDGENWRARFHTAGGAAFLRLNDPNDREAADIARDAIEKLPQRYQDLFRIVDREELTQLGADPHAAFALTASLGVAFSARVDGEAMSRTTGGTHGYHPEAFPEIATGFVGFGPGFHKGVTIHEMGLEDIAPTIAHLLGVPFDSADGIRPYGAMIDATK